MTSILLFIQFENYLIFNSYKWNREKKIDSQNEKHATRSGHKAKQKLFQSSNRKLKADV